MNKLFVNFFLFVTLLLVGASGYVLIEKSTFLDGLYMTLITITTVGYGEVFSLSPPGKYFTMFLMLAGVGFVLYLFSNITDAVIEGRFRQVFGRINMDKKLTKLENHFIVCGYGRIGKVICESLHDSHRSIGLFGPRSCRRCSRGRLQIRAQSGHHPLCRSRMRGCSRWQTGRRTGRQAAL